MSSNRVHDMRQFARRLSIVPLLAFAFFTTANQSFAQGGTLEAIAGVPRFKVGPAPSPAFMYAVYVQGVKITAVVPNLEAKKNNETNAQASQRKAAAVVAELNKSINAAIVAGLLPANTPLATVGTAPAMIPNVDKDGKQIPNQPAMIPSVAAGYGVVVLDGVTGIAKPKDGYRDPSGEPGGTPLIRPGAGSSGGVKASMGGTGQGTGFATGFDPLGNKSFVSFGLFESRALNANCASAFDFIAICPGAYIATYNPIFGQTDAQVFGALAGIFNSLFSSSGFTASYDASDDLLSIDQPINNYLALFSQNTDAGLEVDGVVAIIPEPQTVALLAAGLFGVALFRRRNQRPLHC